MEVINTIVCPIVRQDFVIPALESLYANTPGNFSVIVVDQTMPNLEFEARLRRLCDLHVKSCKYNFGFAQASNIGIRLAPTKFVTVMNDDLTFLSGHDWWGGVMETFKRFKTAIGVNPMSPMEPGWGYGEPGYRYILSFEDAQDPEKVQEVIEGRNGQVIDGITTWCTVFKRKELVEDVGLYDERFTPGSGEDYCLDARAYMAGYRMLATSLAWVWHYWGRSKDSLSGSSVALPQNRPAWNKLDELYPKGFDVWSKKDGKPIYRVPKVARVGLDGK